MHLILESHCSICVPLKLYLTAVPPSSASSRDRSGETRRGKWPKNGNAGWGPPADTFSTGDPTLRDQPSSPCSPTRQWHRIDSSASTLKQGFFSALDQSHATTHDPQESALSQSISIPALLRHRGLLCLCIPVPSVSSLQRPWSSRFLGFGLELWCFFWPSERMDRASFDRCVPRISGHNLPLRQM